MDPNKIKNFSFVKDPVKRMERQVTDWRKCISGKGLISRIFFLTFKALHQKNSLVRGNFHSQHTVVTGLCKALVSYHSVAKPFILFCESTGHLSGWLGWA